MVPHENLTLKGLMDVPQQVSEILMSIIISYTFLRFSLPALIPTFFLTLKFPLHPFSIQMGTVRQCAPSTDMYKLMAVV
jgi:hypothetical protein